MDTLQRAIAWLMNCVRVNRLRQEVRDGVPVFIKRRKAGAGVVIWFGNWFLWLAGSGVEMFVRADEWIQWEIYCSRLLYPQRPAVKSEGAAVAVPKVAGLSLRQLQWNELPVAAFVAAARELKRVHQLPCSYFQAGWSHGDLHLDNIVYDSATDCAVLIDFDTRHEFELDATRRHCDDLQLMLLELVARPDERWSELAMDLVVEYGVPTVLHELSRRLSVPRGFAKVLWHTRTSGSSTAQLERRLTLLRIIVQRAATGMDHAPCSTAGPK